ncbi:hypothetical protein PUNSTDRAFT_135932 [Punctularia strigosozonata HHB-11173 SS5]|uniref:uncharacterized protein n=1 Tax=Punctularia strigosozonata (strain HHB-11173) TaxID=741275 RepID=UPI00044166CF|nr:uncharacterized protein PUNSTDRAFT_135932 [Punctularia strigosozonata HHB-11173 SS5]EIN07246.1 hypothetical protein PUNSTDRAFT_135932 [Punctularia strigosozonata HHB-11173 SS5]
MPSSEPSTVPTWSEIRTQNLRSTFLSGAATGGIWNSWKRGPPGMIPGMVTGALICTLVQLSYNELQVRRLMFLSSRLQELPPAISHTPSPAFDAGQAALPSASSSFSSPSPGKRSFWESTLDTLGKTGMFHRISNEEYLARLKIERDTALQRIEELEAQLAKDHSQSKPR